MFSRSAALSAISGCLLIAFARPASAGAFDWVSDAADAVAGAATTVGNGIADAAKAVGHEMSPVHYDPFKLIGREAMRGLSYIPGLSPLRPSSAGLDEATKDPSTSDEDGDQQQSGDSPDDGASEDMDAGKDMDAGRDMDARCGEDTRCADASAGEPNDVNAADTQRPNDLSVTPQASDSKADDASGDRDDGDDNDPRADTGGNDDESAAAEAADDGASADDPDDDGDGNDAGDDGGDE